MRRWGYFATFSVILISLPLWGQRGGGAHSASGGAGRGASSFRGPSSFRSSASFRSPSSFRGSGLHNGNFGHGSGVRIRGDLLRNRRFRSPYYPYYGYGYYPYLGDFGWYDSSGDQDAYAADGYASNSYSSEPPYREDSGLQKDVQSLSGKIDRLQADVEARNQAKAEVQPATALVFRDKHVEEVRNYAISGATLWVLNQQAAKKIPLAELDLEATVKMNDDRGVDFQVPQPSLSIVITQ